MALFPERKFWMTLRVPKPPLRALAMFLAFSSATTRAQSPGPREFLNTPVNQALFFVDFVGSTSETVNGDLAVPNNESVLRYVSPTFLLSFPLDNKYAGVSVTVPISTLRVKGPAGNAETTGFNDPAIAFHKNIFGLPAFTRAHIGDWVPKTFMSFHITVNPPLGGYDRNAAVNTGANRWAFTPLVNLNIPLNNGVSWIEVYAWGRFFTNNNEFQGNNLLSQDPLGIAGAWYSHNIGKKMYAAIGLYYDYGGETYINHISLHDSASAFRPSLGISRKFRKLGLTFRYENTASKPKAAPTSGLLLLRVSVPPLFSF